MLRGSSFLLDQDYKFFIPVVHILTRPKYDKLWDVDWSRLQGEEREQAINLLFELKTELRRIIRENNTSKKEPTDLLITKIIMSTMGCTPAYDTLFKKGLKRLRIRNCDKFSQSSFMNLLNLKNLNGFYKAERLINRTKVRYPAMKLIDLYFWLRGSKTRTPNN